MSNDADETSSSETGEQAGEVHATPSSADQTVDKLPAPTFQLLISTLGTQALMEMGRLADNGGSPPTARLEHAKHYIDLLGVLEEKTKGNLTSEESSAIGEWLYQLRMAFVTASGRKK